VELVKNDRGSATIETATMFLLIIVLVVGFMCLMQTVTAYSAIQTAAREGAREYSLTDDKTKAVNKAVRELELAGIDLNRAKISAKSVGQERRVSITYQHDFYVPFLGEQDMTVESGAVFRVVGSPDKS
jgi:Flp pilus assembly protein TadG